MIWTYIIYDQGWPGKRQINHLKQLILKIHEKSRFGYRLDEAKRNILRQVVIVFEFNIDKKWVYLCPGAHFHSFEEKMEQELYTNRAIFIGLFNRNPLQLNLKGWGKFLSTIIRLNSEKFQNSHF